MDINLLAPSEVTALLVRHGLRPKKRFGQNFLIDRNVLGRIIAAAELSKDSMVLEVGPGLGTVTIEAAQVAAKVVAVETDQNLMPVLEETVGGYPNVEVVEADFLKLDLEEFLSSRFGNKPCTVVANLPYYITTPLITSFLDIKQRINRIVIMVQQEVAERLAAKPGTSDYGSLSVFVQYHCKVETVAKVKRTVFYPPPEVDSAVIRLDVRDIPAVDVKDEALFFNIVRSAFGQRRKTLLKALSGSPSLNMSRDTVKSIIDQTGIDPTRRGETLSLEEFAQLANAAYSVR